MNTSTQRTPGVYKATTFNRHWKIAMRKLNEINARSTKKLSQEEKNQAAFSYARSMLGYQTAL